LGIVLASALTLIALTALVRLPDILSEEPKTITVTEQNGVYDLTGIANLDEITVILSPGPIYYPNVLLTPETADSAVSAGIGQYDALRAEYLSQRFVLLLPDHGEVYNLSFKLSGRHAMRVYANGRLAGQTGTPGTTKLDTEVWENNIDCNAAAVNGKLDIILNSSHFYHAKRGASLAELTLTAAGTVEKPELSSPEKGLLTTGALLCAAVLLLFGYLLSHTKATLFFTLACFDMALRESLYSQAWTYFPISGNISFMLEYLSMVLLTIFLSLYLGQYIVGRFLRVIQYTAIIGSILYGICVLFGDSVFYTSMLGHYQTLLVLTIVPGISVLFWKMRHPTKEQAAAMYGIGVFFLAAVDEIIMYSDIFGDSGVNAPVSGMAMLVFVLAQTVSLVIMNNRVMSEIRQAEQKLEAEKTALESLNRMKTEFLGNVSHELKTPLTVISGYAQTTKQLVQISDSTEACEVSRRMTLISSEAERLSLMVGQMLDVTGIEEGRMVMEPLRCYIDEIIHTAVETHYPILNKNRNRLDIRIESHLPAIYADPARISQVIVNLISNAVRFTVDGVITISAKKENGKILACVSDTGIGMTPEELRNVFERYGKTNKLRVGQDTGTGLGLYICKHIVEQHGGEIWIESKSGSGTRVFFTLKSAEG
jgi:signal transduction histidine kinase